MTQTQEKREYQPKTGERCHCRRGVQRDNCPDCEGTGMRIDFRAIRARSIPTVTLPEPTAEQLRDGAYGERLAMGLHLTRDEEHPERWKTVWGTYTSYGLWLLVGRMIQNPEAL